MFIGHHAVAFASKKISPTLSLGTLMMAAQFVDLLWPTFLLLGLEHVRIEPGNTAFTPLDFYNYPYTHSLLMALFWSIIVGGVYFALKRNRRNTAVVSVAVFSHWVLDFVTHRPDLPLAFGNNVYVGLGLWNSVVGTVIVEVGLFIIGIALYLRSTRPKDKAGSYGIWGLILFIAVLYIINLLSPPPPNESMIAVVGHASWLFVLWGWWADKHREAVVSQS